ncbi:extracellular solute-binding protein [Maritimibacter sp. HL-12]|uniref:extracellular solute-binding protein n=1 Tax=Maritimibacter sp. HL-12 TaxID=1162418 RepID=UPI000A0F33D2|nr:extracellular solute-binding protein [Maritimibacter sp. HL-12]SMH57054.1 peptide/nickel transport system substrate-binding protein [Maritimibacter sp. HL-12]
MTPEYFRRISRQTRAILAVGVFAVAAAGVSVAEPMHGIAMYGEPALPADYAHLPQVDPDAPKGGRIVFAESGSFDSLNPVIRKGRAPWQLPYMIFETLMGRSYDEPFTLYGLLAESVETAPDRSWVEFTLREEARFSDGNPVTVEDVMWSYETLGTEGHPRYAGAWAKVETMEQTGPRSLRFTFNEDDRELALIMGMRPILQKAQWDGVDFAESGVDLIPIGSAPYVVDRFETGRYLVLKRNPDYWGRDVPYMQGQANFDEIRFDYYGDGDVVFEAFKAGESSTYRETNEAKWDSQYDFPAVQSGEVVLSDIPHQRPTGINGFVMNTRRDQFKDWRVREAMIQAFNFEFINQTLNGGTLPRIRSYFDNSVLGADIENPAEGRVAELLAPHSDVLLPGALEGYPLPVSDGSERNRAGIATALELMEQAGWTVQDGVMADASGTPFSFEILLSQNATESRQIIDIYAAALRRLGISPKITAVDSAQYTERTKAFDFDMAPYIRGLSLSPGNEQKLYWGAALADEPGSRNWMGVKSPAIDAMIDAMLSAPDQDGFRAATKALDRVLTSGRYVIPIWYNNVSHIAHVKELRFPDHIPMYGDWLGFQPEVWWWEE